MSFQKKRRWSIIREYIIGWTLAFVFLYIVRGSGTTENGFLKFDFWSSLLLSCTLGPILGIISGYLQILTEVRMHKGISLKSLILIRFFYSILFLLSLILFSYLVYRIYLDTHIGLLAFVFEPGSLAICFYVLCVDSLLALIWQVKLMLGEGNLWKLLMGKFYTPREEERIFMFLDLQSSTQLAETLGHIQYSKLIQDCFNDLGVVVENEAEIYQYVGDEAILTWKLIDGIRNQNCLNAYFNFKSRLALKEEYYQQHYQCLPFFKAGIHAGIVTVTEVGKYKKEIAYHGDTINTSARIQGKCNEYKQELLISEYLMDKLNTEAYGFEGIGSIALRGKKSEVPMYAVSNRSYGLNTEARRYRDFQ